MNKKWLLPLGLLSIGVLAACGNSNEESSSDESDALSIYTTVYPLQFFAERIAGDVAKVNSILPPGSDSHTYEPTSKDMIEIAEADAFILNGAGLEGYADSIVDAVESEDVTIAEATEGLELSKGGDDHDHGDGHDHDHGDYDPHVWLDPVHSIEMAENIKELLTELKPEDEAMFDENFEALKAELEALDQEFSSEIETASGNHFIVSHAAYGYWEEAYGVHQIAVSGLSPTQEPSQKELQSIVETAEEFGLQHVFFEQNITTKIAEIIREEIGAETLMLHNLSVLTDEDIENDEDYFSLMRHNLEQLNIALEAAPAVEPEGHDHDHDHDHSHELDEEAQKIYDGYFEDDQIEDRPLSDWEGDWQSVYPYLKDGTLDEVFAHKAEEGDKTAEEYKEYYTEGYVTGVNRIVIEDDTFTFYEDGEQSSGVYTYDGYEVLTYEAGNRGVRYIFKLEETQEGTMPAYIQFSDHGISPTDAHHYHLYWGDDREALLEEVVNWPTYYPSDMDGEEIAHEMMAH
ncbi:metal ABC transporter solute-binding protein, Zn/Mn family [Jeotgalibacillus haloalkalitolerans]|uniref:ZinT/AdcA family metal-binding protein n=1 Tax=Jeotgalibacillus haloalkalitolerans TaxID=3104292 RepID=A0ABU5KNC4_9BACL|nr:ZinT/AdcA family metal-binding protein [Jeotgalibacillus sp. HH7-29]MDZ5712763.1 ZinT/AdcA family metal-binding protein [Jeotgalibacillus sp. HH7-29]